MDLREELNTIQNSITSKEVSELIIKIKKYAANHPNEKHMTVDENQVSSSTIKAIEYLGLTCQYTPDQRDGGFYRISW